MLLEVIFILTASNRPWMIWPLLSPWPPPHETLLFCLPTLQESLHSSQCHVSSCLWAGLLCIFFPQHCLMTLLTYPHISLGQPNPTSPEKAMAPHSGTLAWKIPWMEEPGGLQSMGSHRVGHDWATSLSLFTFMHWRRKWQPTPVFLPGESQGWRSLLGRRLWGRTESDTTEAT